MHVPTNYNTHGVFEPSDLDEMWWELKQGDAPGECKEGRKLRAKTIIRMRMMPNISCRAEAPEGEKSPVGVKADDKDPCLRGGEDSRLGHFAERGNHLRLVASCKSPTEHNPRRDSE